MNLNELKPDWQYYSSATATREQKSLNELEELLPHQKPTLGRWFTSYSTLLKNAAMYASIIVLCGGC